MIGTAILPIILPSLDISNISDQFNGSVGNGVQIVML